MIKLAKIGIASAVLAATSLAAVTPASARDNGGVAVVAGIIGLGLGAAIASDRPHYRETRYYDQTPQVYYPQQGYGYGGSYNNGYGNGYAYGDGYNSRERYWEQRRAQEIRQRQWERQRYAHRRDRDDDDRGYGYGY